MPSSSRICSPFIFNGSQSAQTLYYMINATTTQCKLPNQCSFVCVHISKCLFGRGKTPPVQVAVGSSRMETSHVCTLDNALIGTRKTLPAQVVETVQSKCKWDLVRAGCSKQMQVAQGQQAVRDCALVQAKFKWNQLDTAWVHVGCGMISTEAEKSSVSCAFLVMVAAKDKPLVPLAASSSLIIPTLSNLRQKASVKKFRDCGMSC